VTHENDPHGRPQVRQAVVIGYAGSRYGGRASPRGLALPLRLRQYNDLNRGPSARRIKYIMRLPGPGSTQEAEGSSMTPRAGRGGAIFLGERCQVPGAGRLSGGLSYGPRWPAKSSKRLKC